MTSPVSVQTANGLQRRQTGGGTARPSGAGNFARPYNGSG